MGRRKYYPSDPKNPATFDLIQAKMCLQETTVQPPCVEERLIELKRELLETPDRSIEVYDLGLANACVEHGLTVKPRLERTIVWPVQVMFWLVSIP